METTRRGFLQLLGIGGAAAAATSAGIPLFSQGSPLIGAPSHFVFEGGGPRLEHEARAFFLFEDDPSRIFGETVTRLILRNPKLGNRRGRRVVSAWGRDATVRTSKKGDTWAPYGTPSVYQVDCPVLDGEDPHVAFFLGADKLKKAIDDGIAQFAREMRGLTMITQVDAPIMAIPHPERGFYLEVQVSQFAARESEIANLDEVVSRTGAIPLNPPNDISFKYLLLMQEDLHQQGLLENHRSALRVAAQRARAHRGGLALA